MISRNYSEKISFITFFSIFHQYFHQCSWIKGGGYNVAHSEFHKRTIPLGLGDKSLSPAGSMGKTPVGGLRPADEDVSCLGWTQVTDSQFVSNKAQQYL